MKPETNNPHTEPETVVAETPLRKWVTVDNPPEKGYRLEYPRYRGGIGMPVVVYLLSAKK